MSHISLLCYFYRIQYTPLVLQKKHEDVLAAVPVDNMPIKAGRAARLRVVQWMRRTLVVSSVDQLDFLKHEFHGRKIRTLLSAQDGGNLGMCVHSHQAQ